VYWNAQHTFLFSDVTMVIRCSPIILYFSITLYYLCDFIFCLLLDCKVCEDVGSVLTNLSITSNIVSDHLIDLLNIEC
jgi:hypothetical protein